VTSNEYQQLLTQGFQPQNPYLQQTPVEQTAHTQAFQQHSMPAMLPSQMSAPEPAYGMEQPMMPSQMQRHMSHVVSEQLRSTAGLRHATLLRIASLRELFEQLHDEQSSVPR
jgi:hypothetical protein